MACASRVLRSKSHVRLENLETGVAFTGSAHKPLLLKDVTGLRLLPGNAVRISARGEDAEEVVAALAGILGDEKMPGFWVHCTTAYEEHVALATEDYDGNPRYMGQEELIEFSKQYEQMLADRRNGR